MTKVLIIEANKFVEHLNADLPLPQREVFIKNIESNSNFIDVDLTVEERAKDWCKPFALKGMKESYIQGATDQQIIEQSKREDSQPAIKRYLEEQIEYFNTFKPFRDLTEFERGRHEQMKHLLAKVEGFDVKREGFAEGFAEWVNDNFIRKRESMWQAKYTSEYIGSEKTTKQLIQLFKDRLK